jgi:hypothetical protein
MRIFGIAFDKSEIREIRTINSSPLEKETSMYDATRRETPLIQHASMVFAIANRVWILRSTQFCLVTVPIKR